MHLFFIRVALVMSDGIVVLLTFLKAENCQPWSCSVNIF